MVVDIASRIEAKHQVVEVADRDDLVRGDNDEVVQLCHDGRLLVQVLAKCHHLQSRLLDVVDHHNVDEGLLAKGGWGQLVVAD